MAAEANPTGASSSTALAEASADEDVGYSADEFGDGSADEADLGPTDDEGDGGVSGDEDGAKGKKKRAVRRRKTATQLNLLRDPSEIVVELTEPVLQELAGARKPEAVLQAVGFVTRRGDDDGRQIDWLVLVVNETMNAPSNLQKLERLKTVLDAERRKRSEAGVSEASKRKREKDRQLLKFHDQHPSSGKKKKPRR